MQRQSQQKTQETIEAYQRINQGNMRHAALMHERGDLGDLTDGNLSLALAVADMESRVQPATFRQYRAAAIFEIESKPGPFDEEAMEILAPEMSEVEEERRQALTLQRAEMLTELRGSQQRAEHLTQRDWEIFLEALGISKNPWGRITAMWFTCTLITGLRPCEWRCARMKDRTLVVVNAKATNGRAFGPTRTLDLGKADGDTIRLIENFLHIVGEHQGEAFDDMYNGVRNLITKVARASLSPRKRYPTLYTARHSFSSKAKTEFTKRQVAALMGHASPETAPRHYAAARYARGGVPLEVAPSAQDVAAVRAFDVSRGQFPVN